MSAFACCNVIRHCRAYLLVTFTLERYTFAVLSSWLNSKLDSLLLLLHFLPLALLASVLVANVLASAVTVSASTSDLADDAWCQLRSDVSTETAHMSVGKDDTSSFTLAALRHLHAIAATFSNY